MFSVIIPLFNKQLYISKAVQSVLNQSLECFELIIIDDGSTDNSLGEVLKFSDTRIKIVQQDNYGVSTARNNGVLLASYDYIAFLDADDWWHPEFLKEIKYTIEILPDAGAYGTNFNIVKNRKNRPSTVGLSPSFTYGYIDYCKVYARTFCTPINCSFVVVKKAVFQKLKGFRPHLKFGEDFDLWIRLAREYKIAYCNKYLAYSNQDVPTTMRALGDKKWKISEHVIFNINDNDEENDKCLKYLLDGLRLRSLIPFYINGWYKDEVKKEIEKINFNAHPKELTRLYTYPYIISVIFHRLRKVGGLFINLLRKA